MYFDALNQGSVEFIKNQIYRKKSFKGMEFFKTKKRQK